MILLLLCITFVFIEGTPSADSFRRLWTKNVEILENIDIPRSYTEYQCDVDNFEEYGAYDFIIIGGADSAPVLANRLSELNEWTILVLLMGEKNDEFASIPVTDYTIKAPNFGYLTEKQKYACLSMNNYQCAIDRTKSESPRNVYYIRPRKEDFDRWAEAGNSMWSYEENLPYLKKSEEMLVGKILKENDYHGTKGPMPVVNSEVTPPLDYIINTYKELSYPVLSDYNGDEYEGISKMQIHVQNGSKITPIKAYLDPIIESRKSKLKVLYETFAFKIDFDENKKVTGVKFCYNNIAYSAMVTKELILAGGAIISAHLLLLSGIGPKDELLKHDIPVIADLPVGQNLIDNPRIAFRIEHSHCIPPTDFYSEFSKMVKNDGLLGTPLEKLIAFHNIPNLQGKTSSIRITYQSYTIAFNPRWLKNTLNFNDKRSLGISGDSPTDFLIVINFLNQRHRGYLALYSNDPFQHPKIDPGYFTDPIDLNDAYVGYKFVLNLLNTTTMRGIESRMAEFNLPGCETVCGSRFKLNCILFYMGIAASDPIGTTKMGCDATAVVNQNLIVHGVHGLRVVDGGVIPKSISGYASTAEVMIAEKISDVIINLYKH